MTSHHKHLVIPLLAILYILNLPVIEGQTKPGKHHESTGFPTSLECRVQPCYRHRSDGKPGREITITFTGAGSSLDGVLEIDCKGRKESVNVNLSGENMSYSLLLPDGAGVDTACTAAVTFRSGKKEVSASVPVSQLRQWTVYIYPHSHVDIGYTNTQENVELIHKRNLLLGIELAKQTAEYPEGSRYLWNPEVLWPVERYLSKASPAERQMIKDAVMKGYLHLDAGYVHTNTSAAADEELFEYFRECRNMEEFTGTRIETLVQVDVPGMSWGIVPVASQLGIKYCLALNNGSDRVGHSTDLSFRPFWWLGPDGKSKVLFLQPGSYNPGAILKGFDYWPLMAGQTDTSKLLRIVKTNNPRHNFIDKYLDQKLPELEMSDYYPYDIFVMSWAMADNTPIDADLPDAVRSWNDEYAYPHLIIAGATQIMSAFEKKYGDRLPVLKGDFTEYWTDGLGTAAKQTGMNRVSKERLIQAEILWRMLDNAKQAPENSFSEAWRNVIMGTEHTWCYMDPSKQPITNNILAVKFGYFQKASELSDSLLKGALSAVSDSGSRYIGVFNTLQWPHSGPVRISASECGKYKGVTDEHGKPVISQRLSSGDLLFYARNVPAYGSAKYVLVSDSYAVKGSMARDNAVDNGIVRAEIDRKTGDIKSLILGTNEFAGEGKDRQINSFRYLRGADKQDQASGTADPKISIIENGPLLATIAVETEAEGCRSLIREVSVVAGEPFIAVRNIVDKKAVKEKEGIHFGFGFNISDHVTHADIPWGIIEIDKDQLAAGNRNWIAFQRWLDISGGNRGITICSLDAPVFESGALTANIIGGATNSPEWIRDLKPSSTIWSWALNNHWHTNFPLSQEGKIVFRYLFIPHNSQYDPAFSERFGLEQAQPLISSPVKPGFKTQGSLVVNDNRDVIITILKCGDRGGITTLRLRSLSGKDEKTRLTWTDPQPRTMKIMYNHEDSVSKAFNDEISVPAGGFVTAEVQW